MKISAITIGAAAIMLVASCSCQSKKETNSYTTDTTVSVSETKHAVAESENALPIVIDFYADWCGPCKRLAPILETVEKDYVDRVEFRRVNIDENQDLAVAYGIESIPTLVFVDNKGNEVARTIGLVSIADIEENLHILLKK